MTCLYCLRAITHRLLMKQRKYCGWRCRNAVRMLAYRSQAKRDSQERTTR